MTYYRQCTYERMDNETRHWDVTWLPERFAVVGTIVKFTVHGEDRFEVVAVGPTRRTKTEVSSLETGRRNFGPSIEKRTK